MRVKGAVTITNMAGRGTDIKLGEGVPSWVDFLWSEPSGMSLAELTASCVDVVRVGAIRTCPEVLRFAGRRSNASLRERRADLQGS